MPDWLSYNADSGILEGVPTLTDKGTFVLSAAGDLFALTVRDSREDEVARQLHSAESSLLCKPQDSVTRVTVALNTDNNGLIPSQRVRLIEETSKHLSVSKEHLSFRAERQGDMLDQSAALVSGLGDQKRKSSQLGSVLYWVVGCGAVKSHQMEILERLEATAKNGSLGQAIGSGISSWQVTISKPRSAGKRRLKREVVATQTPTPGIWHHITSFTLSRHKYGFRFCVKINIGKS